MLPRWMSWLILVFIGYALASADFSATPDVATPTGKPEASYPALAKVTDKNHWLSGINPDYVGPPRWREVTPGEGESAVCGQEIEVTITGLKGKEPQSQTIRVGKAPYAVLDTALVGIKPGGVREIAAPARDIYPTDKKASGMTNFTVERQSGAVKSEEADAQPRAK